MKRISILTLLLLFVVGGVNAAVITDTPKANTPYLIKCIATDHVGYLGDDGTTLQGRHATGTFFILEPTGTEGQYYLKSQKSGKYINAAGVTSGSAITFDNEATTYWTLDQTNANTSLNSWAIRPNGTVGVSLNNNGASNAACPWMKVNVHSNSGQGCDLWTFDDDKIHLYEKPKFGGTVWTWNTGTGKFEADGKEATATPGRENSMGPLLKFVNVGTVTASTGGNTSDSGGIWVIGNNSNVTCGLGEWAGSILVEDYAVASVSYSRQLKGTEPVASATVWTNGKLVFTGRTNFDMNDGQNQRWYIGENGVVNTSFTSVSRGTRTWDLQVVVADMPARADATRTTKQLQKKVMTWGADISAQINSITVWYKDSEGNLTQLDNSAVTCDATGITVTYEGLGYDEKTPSLPEGKYISVSGTKADFLTPATAADDNAHWYVLTQQRDGESPVYDNGSYDKMMRATAGTTPAGQLIPGNEKYLVRFFQKGEGLYDIQFATGKFVSHDLKTGTYGEGGTFNLYNINGQATHIGWNKPDFANRVDNNGAGSDLVYYESGEITEVTNPVGNNDWSIYPVEFVSGVPISYTFHSVDLNTDFTGSYVAGWAGDNTQLPELAGVAGYTLTNVVFSESDGNYTLTADFAFPFPVSDATTQRPTGIESQLGNSKWYVNDENKMKANNAANTTLTFATQDNFKWNIYPTFSGGTFSFKIQHHGTSKYIPAFTAAQDNYGNTENAVVEEANAGTFYFLPCTGAGKGFSINPEGTVYLTINTSGPNQNIWTWTKSGSHQGSNLTFPDVTITKEGLQAQIAELAGATKFNILEGSIVQGPSEIAHPSRINIYIDKAKAVDRENIEAMETFLASTYADTIKDYLDDMATYGSLHTCHLEITRPYTTLILPCPSTRPAGINLYGCSAIEANNVTLTLNAISGAIAQNVPYIIEAPVGNKYTIIGWLKPHEDTHTSGWLTGVLKEGGALVPAQSYALAYQKSTGKQAFFRTDGTVTCPQFKCYLTIPSSTEPVKALYFDNDGLTGIESIFGADGQEVEIYNLAGQRIQKLQKGVNIVNGRKVLVK